MPRFALALICAVGTLSFNLSASAQTTAPAAPDCAARATEKKLAGAALNSFMKKCERDAATRGCEAAAAEKKLAGAARTSFTIKCVKDAVSPPASQ